MTDCFRDLDLHIFDLDDTLINTRRSYTAAQAAAFDSAFPKTETAERNFHLELLSWLCQRFGSGCPDQYFKAFIQCSQLSVENERKILDTLVKAYHDVFHQEIRPLEGAIAYLEALRSSRRKLAIVSNGLVDSQNGKISNTRLAPYFPKSARFISESFPPSFRKPSPYMISLACREMGTEKSDAVYYGNVLDDIVAGNLAGVTTVLVGKSASEECVPHKIAEPHFRLESWKDVID